MNESKYVYTYKHVQVWQGGAKKIIIAPKVFASRRKHPVPKGGKILVSGIPLLVLVGNVVNTAPNFWYPGYKFFMELGHFCKERCDSFMERWNLPTSGKIFFTGRGDFCKIRSNLPRSERWDLSRTGPIFSRTGELFHGAVMVKFTKQRTIFSKS